MAHLLPQEVMVLAMSPWLRQDQLQLHQLSPPQGIQRPEWQSSIGLEQQSGTAIHGRSPGQSSVNGSAAR